MVAEEDRVALEARGLRPEGFRAGVTRDVQHVALVEFVADEPQTVDPADFAALDAEDPPVALVEPSG